MPIRRNVATARQVNANRENAKRSTGPKTAAGKANVRYNAMKHGLLAEAALLPDENEATFRDFSARIRSDLHPVGEMEFILVDRITNILWRLRRFSHVETGLFVREAVADERAGLDAMWEARRSQHVDPRPEKSSARRSEMDAKVDEVLVALEVAYLGHSEARDANPRQRLGDAFAYDAATGNAFTKLARYETQLNRTLERTLNQLQDLQHQRPAQSPKLK
jgi:hypothetical protein